MHIPCGKKQMAFPSMMTHFTLYHRMKPEVAKIILQAMKTKSLNSDSILFENNQRLAVVVRKT
jgi:hypothetical protein